MYDLHIFGLEFAWDPAKERANRRKHRVSFREAATVFLDENASLFHDPDHPQDEDRYILLGMSGEARLLVVRHCYREGDALIRVISARKADRRESAAYRRGFT
jgi:uncharacterized DUF497 family protein